jgi:lon-related putative ATP-dependent protease
MTQTPPQLKPAPHTEPLSPARLYTHCDQAELGFETTAELEPLHGHLGQDRALEALQFGLSMPHEGYNIYLLGNTGTGKRELLRSVLDAGPGARRTPVSDWCYVNNFEAPDQPLVLQLPPGLGGRLRADMASAVEELLGLIPATFQSDDYQAQVQELGEHYHAREQEAFQALAESAREQGVAMIQTPNGYTLAPTAEGEIIKPEDFEALPEEQKEQTLASIEKLKDELKQIVRQLPGWKKESRERFKHLNSEFSQLAIDPVFVELNGKYQDYPAVLDYLGAVHTDVGEQAEAFAQVREESAIPENMKERVKEFPQYSVNVVVDNSDLTGAPVVYEDNPGFANLLGRVEHMAQMGMLVTDFTLIKPGALHRANGGYLVLDADKILSSPYAWTALKRALKSEEIRIQSLEQILSLASTVQLQPHPIPLDVKVVISGDRYLYYLLQRFDPEFSTLFKVPADMSEEVERSGESIQLFARMIRSLQDEKKLLPLGRDAVARVIEFAARSLEDSQRLSLHRGKLSNLMAESDHLARLNGATSITATHVQAAAEAAIRRMDQFRSKSHENILRDLQLVTTSGTAIGQVNGLSVYLLGDYSFGKPTRITATARLGTGKVLDIEREVELGGNIHSKAVMIISSLLANRYARERPLPLAATVVFEQSYGGVEGDSASVAEFTALVSAIADIPVKQGLAVTGSLNQHGQVQAIGGVNEKIEGHYDVCRVRGLDGNQGVVIPSSNEVHLMLREDVIASVASGEFHIYSVDHIDRALEILTGFSVASIDCHVRARVEALQSLAQQFSGKENDDHAHG